MHHSSSIISEKAKIGENVKIGRFCIIEDDVEIGDNSFIGDYTTIMAGSKLGKNVTVKSYCEIRREVIIGDNCSFGSRCTLTHYTKIGKNCNIKFGFVTTTLDFKKGVDLMAGVVGDNVTVGASVILMPGAHIENGAMIGACSQLRQTAKENEIWYGSPAKFYKMVDEL